MTGKKILITGASGYIGSKLVDRLANSNKLFLITRSPGRKRESVKYINIDIKKKSCWKNILKDVHIVYHFAAQTSSQYSNKYPSLDLKTNLLPIVNMIEACIKHNFSPDIVFAGTATETGYTNAKSIHGNINDSPITIYDINKLAAEKYLQYYSSQLLRRATTLRLSNVFGPGKQSGSSDRGIVNMMILKALNGEPLTIYGNGKYIRDYIYIDDVISAFVHAADHIHKTKGNFYTIGSGVGYEIKSVFTIIAETIFELARKKVKIISKPFPKKTSKIEYRNFIADSSDFKNVTGWSPKMNLKEGIINSVKYYITHCSKS